MIEPSNEVSAAISRRAAERLAGIDSGLAAATERLLQGAPRRRSLDAGTSLAFASLVVSLAQFGWQLYQDQLRQKAKPEVREVLVRTLRVRVEESGGFLPPAQLDRVVEVVAEEILG
ncbi:MAG: hypothetical protein ACJ759_12680 [Thermoanaerobaculia bacterium]